MALEVWSILQWILMAFLAFLFFLEVVARIVRHYRHFPVPAFMTQLMDNPVRRRFIQKPGVIADRMRLEPGMVVLEIGPGKGGYTKVFAEKILPGGVVYVVDIQESVVKRLRRRFDREGVTNVYPRIDDAHNLSLGEESIDRVIAMSCLPEIPDPTGVLRECWRVLKRDGLVCLCEILTDPDYPLMKTEIRWAEEVGLELREKYGNFFMYQLNFGKNIRTQAS